MLHEYELAVTSVRYTSSNTDSLCVSAFVLVEPGLADCQFPVYLWQSLSTTWSARVHHGDQQKWWTSRTLYPHGDSSNWTLRWEIAVRRSQLTIKAVTKAVCLDSGTNTSIVCNRKDVLQRVVCLTAGINDIYSVQIHAGGQVNNILSFSRHLIEPIK